MTTFFVLPLLLAPAPPAAPSLSGQTPWGELVQVGKNITITGTTWTAAGTIKGDTVTLVWTHGERQAYGVYRVVQGGLAGHYGWCDESEIVEGDLCGEIHVEAFNITTR